MRIEYLAIPIIALTLGLLVLTTPSMNPVSNNEGLVYKGFVCVYKNDQLVECKHNLITNGGKTLIQNAANGLPINITNISVGNNTVTQGPTDTVLQGQWNTTCGLGYTTNVLYNNAGTGQWNISYQWTSSCDGAIVNATGLSNYTNPGTAAGGQLFAETTFTSVTLQTNDRLNVTWGLLIP